MQKDDCFFYTVYLYGKQADSRNRAEIHRGGTMPEKEFMKAAIRKGLTGVGLGQTPFGACIVKKGRVIVTAHNVVWKTTDITAHAEVNAIRLACRKLKTIDLSGCEIYSTCEPCPMCFSAIHWARFSRVVYGTTIADAARLGFNELSLSNRQMKKITKSPVKIEGPFLRAESLKLFHAFAHKPGKKVY